MDAKNLKMDTRKILVGVIGILLVFSIIQTLQLNAIANDVGAQEGKIKSLETGMQKLYESNLEGIKTTSGSSSGSSSLVGRQVQSAPQMVGGC